MAKKGNNLEEIGLQPTEFFHHREETKCLTLKQISYSLSMDIQVSATLTVYKINKINKNLLLAYCSVAVL